MTRHRRLPRVGGRPRKADAPLALAITAACLLTALTGCAGAPVSREKLAVAEASVERAERADAARLAAVEMGEARQKLQAAQSAAERNQGEEAARLAEQADVAAQLAEATARASRANRSVSELDESLRALREEAQRNANPSSAPARIQP